MARSRPVRDPVSKDRRMAPSEGCSRLASGLQHNPTGTGTHVHASNMYMENMWSRLERHLVVKMHENWGPTPRTRVNAKSAETGDPRVSWPATSGNSGFHRAPASMKGGRVVEDDP